MTPTSYNWSGGTESLLRFGPANGPLVLAALPPLEEANRTRAFTVTILRALAERGIASALPDLPGTGDSMIATEDASLNDWQAAYASAARSCAEHSAVHGFALRGGALLDRQAVLASRYHLAPSHGAALVRDLLRTRLAAAKEDGELFDPTAIAPPGPPILLAGNHVDRRLLADLGAASPGGAAPVRTARLQTDAQHADIKFAAAPLWRRAEPGNDRVLAALVADDIAAWIVACAA